MTTTVRVLLATIIGIALVGCASTASEQDLRAKDMKPLTQAELVALFDGTVRPDWRIPSGDTGTSVFREDGTAAVDWGPGGSKGTYRLVDGEFCTTWEEIRDGKEACGTLYQTAEGEYMRFIDGELNSTWWFET